MLNKLTKKLAIIAGLFAGSAGIALAAFLITQTVSVNNTVTAASAGLTITSTPINLTGLVAGGSTAPNALTIKNTGSYAGTVKLNIVGKTGTLCSDISLAVAGDATGTFDPVANTSVDLGTLAPGATLNLTQVVSMKASSTQMGSNCTWNETATLSN